MKKKYIRWVLIGVLLVVFAVSSVKLVHSLLEYRRGDQIYSAASDLVDLPDLSGLPVSTPRPTAPAATAPSGTSEPSAPPETAEPSPTVYVDPYADALQAMDFTALRQANSDVRGWILIPNTVISYPIVQGEDNDFYLSHAWQKARSSVGAIFMECTNSPDMSDFNTIIYGHRMANRSMFGSLYRFADLSYWEQHPYVYVTSDFGTRRYDIFAAYEVSTAGMTYRLGLRDDGAKQEYIDFCLEQSVIDTGIVPTVNDSILTLSTCTGNGHATRWIVQAVYWNEQEPETPQESEAPEDLPADAPQEGGAQESAPQESGAPVEGETPPVSAPEESEAPQPEAPAEESEALP